MDVCLAERVPHSIISSEKAFRYQAADVSAVDFAVTSGFVEVPPSDSPRLEVILSQRIGSSEARFPDHSRSCDFQKLGKMFMFPSGEKLEIRGECERLSVVLCKFTSKMIAQSLGEDCDWSPLSLRSCLDIHNRQVFSSVVRLQRELRYPTFASEIMGEALVVQIAVDLARHFADVCRRSRVASGGLSPLHLRLLIDRIEDGGAPPSLAELAELSGLSVRQLTRGFRASKGQTIGSYIAAHRLQRAKDQLASGKPIKQIAIDIGFRSSNHFAMAFRRETGLTPSEFRYAARRPS